jgi:hypothetical protein
VSGPIEPAEAARALGEIDRRREQVIRRRIFPRWWWWAYAVLMTVFAACVESGRGVLVGLGIAVFLVGSFAVDVPVRRAARAAAPRRGLAPGSASRTLIGLSAFAALVLGAAIATGLGLKAAGVCRPGTIAAAVAGVVFAVAGPVFVRSAEAMLVRRSGGRR